VQGEADALRKFSGGLKAEEGTMREQLAALVEKLRHSAVENDHAHAELMMVFLSPLPLSLPGTN